MKNALLVLLILAACFIACTKSPDVKMAQGKIVLGICGKFVIQLNDNTLIEPMNLGSFNQTFVKDQSVTITYKRNSDMMSYCMVGELVDLVAIRAN